MRIAVICVGNKLMLDDGIGPAVYEELKSAYSFPDDIALFDVGCMTLDMISMVEDYELMITVDAVDGSDEPPGTIFRYRPEEIARREGSLQSMHDLRLADVFDAAALLEYKTEGLCLGMQVENAHPAQITIGLTPSVYENLPRLVETVLAELLDRGARINDRETGQMIRLGHTHVMRIDRKDDIF